MLHQNHDLHPLFGILYMDLSHLIFADCDIMAFLPLLLLLFTPSVSSTVVLRSNFGVALVRHGKVSIGQSLWRQYFSFPFPRFDNLGQNLTIPRCNELVLVNANHCVEAANFTVRLNDQRAIALQELKNKVDRFRRIIPVKIAEPTTTGRTKRS